MILFLVSPPHVAWAGELEGPSVTDMAVMGAGLVVWGGGEFFKEELAPEQCRWCATNPLDESVRDTLVWNSGQEWAARSSDVLLGGVVLAGIGLAQWHSEEEGDGLAGGAVVVESVAVSAMLNQVVKFAVGRERPYVRTLDDPESVSRDRNLSFYSGHTSTAFAAAVAGAWAYDLEGGDHPTLVWSALLGSAALVGYMRIAADRHYLTDVLTGAAVGSFVGWGMVTIHRKAHTSVTPLLYPSGDGANAFLLGISGVF